MPNTITPEIAQIVKVLFILGGVVHMLVGLVLFRQTMSANNSITTNSSGCLRLASIVHILSLVGILILIILL